MYAYRHRWHSVDAITDLRLKRRSAKTKNIKGATCKTYQLVLSRRVATYYTNKSTTYFLQNLFGVIFNQFRWVPKPNFRRKKMSVTSWHLLLLNPTLWFTLFWQRYALYTAQGCRDARDLRRWKAVGWISIFSLSDGTKRHVQVKNYCFRCRRNVNIIVHHRAAKTIYKRINVTYIITCARGRK